MLGSRVIKLEAVEDRKTSKPADSAKFLQVALNRSVRLWVPLDFLSWRELQVLLLT